jgi:DNA-binding MarR family transcriptional regulator
MVGGALAIYLDMANEFCLSEYWALATLHDQLQRVMDGTEHRAREAGLQRIKFRLLIAIRRQPADVPATIGGLAEALDMDRTAVVELVDELARQKFVVRERDRTDRRRFLISITPAGDEWLKPLVEGDLRELAAAGPGLMRALRTVMTHAATTAERGRSMPRADVADFAWRALGPAPI